MPDQPAHTGKSTKFSKPSYAYAIVSISLVLFLLGLLGVVLIQAQKLSTYFKENIELIVILDDAALPENIAAFKNEIARSRFTKTVEYVSKTEAMKRFSAETNENPDSVLGYNPLFSSFNLYLKAAYTNADSLANIEKTLKTNALVKDVFYQKAIVDLINVNVSKVGIFLLALSLLFFAIAFVLIDNTIKLAMYSNRFLVKSMQLVGATRWFIARPFITQSVYNGLISGMLASVLLALVLLLFQKNIPEAGILHEPLQFVLICLLTLITGVFISWWSTKKSVIKYLQLPLDDLY
ncbi:cell division protein FtsX [Sphingobacteriales bacterium UPWRP_1]|nr:hypothetical protein B6N25_17430 [Sphingobacteriales bacterium TSM_CSS]PSJ72817.1 cell division protein FtsX [Sphingobacteriales bacterium UPWRP_1]